MKSGLFLYPKYIKEESGYLIFKLGTDKTEGHKKLSIPRSQYDRWKNGEEKDNFISRLHKKALDMLPNRNTYTSADLRTIAYKNLPDYTE
jgi:hypothetical protein